jgi:tRNA G18 (ribose-2'-O)-methylase SpoU
MREVVLIVHDIRSTHNVGSLLRTAEGLGVSHLYFTGYTPYPPLPAKDERLPHLAQKLGKQINKTALGAENSVPWSRAEDVAELLNSLKSKGFRLVALEQAATAMPLPDYQPPQKVALLLGREVEGIDRDLLTLVDDILEIPMFGSKESFNVAQAAAIALYHLRFTK